MILADVNLFYPVTPAPPALDFNPNYAILGILGFMKLTAIFMNMSFTYII